jgi:molecular chaperone GrpE
MVQKQFLVALERFSVKPFEAEGLPFDPQVHEAIQQVDSDKLPAGSVAMVFQRGYKLGARLLRPAMVAVVKAKPVQSAGEPGTLH